jgi:hypothetical protein
MKLEQPTTLSWEKQAKIEKEKTLSDAELIKGGTEHKINGKGEKMLNPTEKQVEEAKKEMLGAKETLEGINGQEIIPTAGIELKRDKSSDVCEKAIRQKEFTSFEKWIENIKKQEEIGSGAEKRVFVHPDDPQKIVAVFRGNESVYKIKERFYINKILSLLYPNNIPDIHLAASQPAVLVIDHIIGKKINSWNLKHLFQKIIIEWRLKKVGIHIDDNSCNFMADQKNGKVFYIDGFIGDFRWDKERLLKSINKLNPQKRQKALNYLNRLEVIYHQEEREWVNDN